MDFYRLNLLLSLFTTHLIMKEIDLVRDLAHIAVNNGRPEPLKEATYRLAMAAYFRLHSAPPEARYHVNGQIIPDLIAGKKRSLAEDAVLLLSFLKSPAIVLCSENIPPAGPLLITPNHYSHGPYHGLWKDLRVAVSVESSRGEDMKFILQDSLTNRFTNKRIKITREFFEALSKTYGVILVPPPDVHTSDGEVVGFGSARNMIESFKNGEAVGLYPEVRNSTKLKTGHALAGRVADAFYRTTNGEGQILPVGVFKSGIHFGEPYFVSDMQRFFVRSRDPDIKWGNHKDAANYMMSKVNQLVPEKLRNPILTEIAHR